MKHFFSENHEVGTSPLRSTHIGRTVARFAALAAILFGSLALLGWEFGIELFKSLIPGFVAMNPVTALALILAGVSLLIQGTVESGWKTRRMSQVLASAVLIVGLLKLAGVLFRWNLGIDQILFHDKPGFVGATLPNQISPNAAAAFFLIGSALLLLDEKFRGGRPSQFLALAASIIPLLAIIGYADGTRWLYGIAAFIPLSLNAAMADLALCIGILFVRPDVGLASLFLSDSAGGITMRRLLPIAVALPILLGGIRMAGQRAGLYGNEFGAALTSMVDIVVLATLVYLNAKRLHHADLGETKAKEALIRLNESLQHRTTELEAAIAERKQREEELWQSEQRLTLASTAGEVGVWDLDLVADRAWRSLQHDRIFGYESLLPLWSQEIFFSHVVPEDFELVKQRFEEAMRTGRLDFECRIIRADQVERWINAKGEGFRSEQGQLIRVMGVVADITERKRGEEMRERLAALVDSSGDAIIAKTLDGKISAWNRGAEKLFGYTADEAEGKPIMMLFPPGGMNEEAAIMARIERGETVDSFDTTRIRKDGKPVDVSVALSPIKDSRGGIVGASKIVRDITERRRAEERLRQLNAELEERAVALKAANQELEAFTYSVSHDLRAPLRHIAGFSKILTEDFAPHLPAEGRRMVERISAGARNAGQLVDDLLSLSRVGRTELKLEIVGLKGVVEGVVRDLEGDAAGREIEWRIGELPFLECDAALLKQVMINLLGNALKYTRPRAKAVIETGTQVQDGQTVVYVRDNGVGFSMKYADKLFGVFQRLHRSEDFEGTGVGLATVQRIVHKHGGRVWAEAVLDKGATFCFTLSRRLENEGVVG